MSKPPEHLQESIEILQAAGWTVTPPTDLEAQGEHVAVYAGIDVEHQVTFTPFEPRPSQANVVGNAECSCSARVEMVTQSMAERWARMHRLEAAGKLPDSPRG